MTVQDHKAWAVVEHIRKKIAECDESLKATPERQAKLQEGLEEQEQKLRDLEARTMQLVCCATFTQMPYFFDSTSLAAHA